MPSNAPTAEPFYVPVDLSHTALLLADIQDQIASRFSAEQLAAFTTSILRILTLFRSEISRRRTSDQPQARGSTDDLYDGVPLIIHHVFPAGINSNAFISPYNKLARWFANFEASGAFTREATDPNTPSYQIVRELLPPSPDQPGAESQQQHRWAGSNDEIIVPKLTAGCFSSSDLQGYLRARGVRHVVLCGLTTAGTILGSARLGADLDFHVVVPREGVMDDDPEVNAFLLDRVLPRFVDVVPLADVEGLFQEC